MRGSREPGLKIRRRGRERGPAGRQAARGASGRCKASPLLNRRWGKASGLSSWPGVGEKLSKLGWRAAELRLRRRGGLLGPPEPRASSGSSFPGSPLRPPGLRSEAVGPLRVLGAAPVAPGRFPGAVPRHGDKAGGMEVALCHSVPSPRARHGGAAIITRSPNAAYRLIAWAQ